MRRKLKLGKIITKRSYSTKEIAELLGVHIQTIRGWRKEGLNPIELNISPFLFLGSDVKEFLTNQRKQHKIKLDKNQFYCFRCKKAINSLNIKVKDREITIGKGKHSILLESECPECNLKVRKFSVLESNQESNITIQINQEIKESIVVGEQLSMF